MKKRRGEIIVNRVQLRMQNSMASFSLFGVAGFWWKNCAVLFACLADTMPRTVAGKSTTARVMSESRALVKGSGRRKGNGESGKDMGEIEIFFMYGYGSLAESE